VSPMVDLSMSCECLAALGTRKTLTERERERAKKEKNTERRNEIKKR